MKLKWLFIATAVIANIFGFVFLILPAQVYSLYGVTTNAQLNYMGRLFGATLLVKGLVAWKARNAADSEARRAIVFGIFVADVVGFLVALNGQLHVVVNSLGWTTVAIYFVLAMGFAYFQFSKPASVDG